MRTLLSLGIVCAALLANETNLKNELNNEEIRANMASSFNESSNINLLNEKIASEGKLNLNETPCFKIDKISLLSENEVASFNASSGADEAIIRKAYNTNYSKFNSILEASLNKLDFKSGSCLGKNSINLIINSFNNEIIKSGYITSSASLVTKSLKDAKLEFVINLGLIDDISINELDSQRNRASLFSAFGEYSHKNKVANIRDIEQALESLQNVSKNDVSIKFLPSNRASFSNIVITRVDSFPLKAAISLDNLGSKQSGKYQAMVNLSTLNLLGFNEIFSFSRGKDVLKKYKVTNKFNGASDHGASNNYYYGFSIPFGYFMLEYEKSKYDYAQIINAAYNLYTYKGRSESDSLSLAYTFYRDSNFKNSAYVKLFKRKNKNYLEDYELDNQARRNAGYEVGVKTSYNSYNQAFSAKLAYKKGTGIFNSQPDPLEDSGEATSRFALINLNLNYKYKFELPLSYDLNINARYGLNKLSLQDKFSIGGYYSVRGFDGESSLVGNHGVSVRNTLSYNYYKSNSIYAGLDAGVVRAPSSGIKDKNTLAGYAIGLRGSIKAYNNLSYDISVSKPLYKPKSFETKSTNVNFIISYEF
ncbi:ShlB/FhaC/HecB family hemolysin secretion/activation protein [Campylobacter concisus]|uniref:ShlB/FhaC/HecB family hemolysin secretion/activation protein n=1 Tax=Campylobacter concisus TaxID=199 RepID=A0A2R4NYL5_9BACT|nr:ShlB/FhaC/HecB family hemolysin secretion/activation protein [Campylobacter concisus]AVX43291.1 ShlB/FhaC/HecB family hemolysin secretion/activation protein [Campylobacter concisus]